MKFELPDLSYKYKDLEPHIDFKTMEIHHEKHHYAYVDNLNKLLEQNSTLKEQKLEDLLLNPHQIQSSIREQVLNYAGGHYNHSFFWTIMGPKAQKQPKERLAKDLIIAYGSFDEFKEAFSDTALNTFGSGWTWLGLTETKRLSINSLPNQDVPIAHGIEPLLCIDVWEHAYYLKYQNKRAEYIKSWWNVVNWYAVEQTYHDLLGFS